MLINLSEDEAAIIAFALRLRTNLIETQDYRLAKEDVERELSMLLLQKRASTRSEFLDRDVNKRIAYLERIVSLPHSDDQTGLLQKHTKLITSMDRIAAGRKP